MNVYPKSLEERLSSENFLGAIPERLSMIGVLTVAAVAIFSESSTDFLGSVI